VSTNGANWIFLEQGGWLSATEKNQVGVRGGFLQYFFAAEKSITKKI
jgi:hypothetical protein